MACKICETRRPRRYCPGVGGDICSVCCGTEREVSITCPLECEYLQEAHSHERVPPVDPEQIPNRDIRLTEQYLEENETLVTFVGASLLQAALETPGTVDADVREALDSLARTYRTRESGLYYETRPANLLAGNIHQRVQQRLEEYRQQASSRHGITTIRDADILGVLVFWQRLAISNNNRRERGRALLGFLHTSLAEAGLRPPGGLWRGGGSLIAP